MDELIDIFKALVPLLAAGFGIAKWLIERNAKDKLDIAHKKEILLYEKMISEKDKQLKKLEASKTRYEKLLKNKI